jgi:hypothetical protein
MPTFIQRVDDPQIPSPYDLSGIDVRSFELKADMGELRKLCDTLLNIGSLTRRGFEYRPVLPYVALEVLTYARMTSTVPPFSGYGFITQREIYFRLLVCRYDLVGRFLAPAQLYNFFPFIVVDNAWSAFSGREVLGFPKVIGTITQNSERDTSYTAELSLPVFKTFSATTEQTSAPVISIRTGKTVGATKFGRLAWPWVIFDELSSQLSPALLQWSEMIDPSAFSTVHLKQFRNAEIATEACFQGLVTAEFSITSATPHSLFESAEVTLFPAASLDLAKSLGLPSSGPLQATIAYQLSCSMTYGNVRNQFVLEAAG